MLLWIAILGGLLIMMGHHARSEALLYYFRLEDQVPENHLLRLIDEHISFGFVGERLKDSYSDTGRPSIDPELLLRILLIGWRTPCGARSHRQSNLGHRSRKLDRTPGGQAVHQGQHLPVAGVAA